MRSIKPILAILPFCLAACATAGGGRQPVEAGISPEARELVAILEQDFNYDESFSVVRGGMVHYLKSGETVAAIAEKYAVPVIDLLEINNIKNPNTLAVGTRIYIPKVVVTKEEKEAPPKQVAEAPLEPEMPRQKEVTPIPGTPSPAKPGRGMGTFRNLCWPVAGGQISSRFGQRWGRNHDGLDLPGPLGTPVRAAEAGEVILSTFNEGGYGNLIIIKHKDNWFTVYAHNKRNLVKRGDKVRKCQQVAEVGNTGRSTGPHCHFEVREEKTPRDPILFLEP